MRIEIKSAANFLVDLARLNNDRLTEEQLEKFRDHVCEILRRHYTDHWFPDRPFKGSGYRCIRINGQLDPLIARAGFIMGLTVSFLRSLFPTELTMWVDPMEVAYRIGENGSICVLYEEEPHFHKKPSPTIITTTSETSLSHPTETNKSSPVKILPQPPPPPPPQQAPVAAPSSTSPPPPTTLSQHHQQQLSQQQQHQQQQQVHHHHHHHHHHQQHHFSPSKSVVVSSSLQHHHQSPPMSPVATHHHHQQQQAAAAAMQLFLMGGGKDVSGVAAGGSLVKCKESLRGGLDARPLQMDRLFVSS